MAVQKLLLAGVESVYGTEEALLAANAIETMNLEFARYEGDRVERDLDRTVIGGRESINTNPHISAGFSVGAQGSGTAGTAPAHGVLWRGCGFDEVIVPGVSVAYQLPISSADLVNSDSLTLFDYREQVDQVQKSSGVRGANSWTMSRGDLPKFVFRNLRGSYNRPAQETPPAIANWDNWREEIPFTNANVQLTLDSLASCTEAFDIDFGQSVQRRNLPNCQQTIISDYNTTGSMTIVAPDIATKNWFADVESDNGITKVPFSITYGTVAGLIVSMTAAEVQITNISDGESAEGDLTYSFDLSFLDNPVVTFT